MYFRCTVPEVPSLAALRTFPYRAGHRRERCAFPWKKSGWDRDLLIFSASFPTPSTTAVGVFRGMSTYAQMASARFARHDLPVPVLNEGAPPVCKVPGLPAEGGVVGGRDRVSAEGFETPAPPDAARSCPGEGDPVNASPSVMLHRPEAWRKARPRTSWNAAVWSILGCIRVSS